MTLHCWTLFCKTNCHFQRKMWFSWCRSITSLSISPDPTPLYLSPVLHEFWTILSRFTKQEEKKKGKWKPRVPSHPTGQMKALAGCKEDRIGALKPPWYYCWSFAENSDLRVLIETLQILIALCKLATINNMHNMAHSYLVLFIFKNSACIFSVTFLLTFYTP